jgi:hypothetical protein
MNVCIRQYVDWFHAVPPEYNVKPPDSIVPIFQYFAIIVDLRKKLETANHTSFWLHIDGAWGGFLRTLLSPARSMDAFIHISKQLRIRYDGKINNWKCYNGNVFSHQNCQKRNTVQGNLLSEYWPDHLEKFTHMF